MPAPEVLRERDLVLGPNEYTLILDESKGNIASYVGPMKTSLSNTDRPVVFEEKTRMFRRCELQEATKVFPSADEGFYLVLKNPTTKSATGEEENPKPGLNVTPKLQMGRKINIPGPVSFPLWPGQIASVIEGHRLRSNQYLVVRVYNDEEAKKHWATAVVKPQVTPGAGDQNKNEEGQGSAKGGGSEQKAVAGSVAESKTDSKKLDLVIGQLLIIKGTDVSFYIPPTGIEVVPDKDDNFVRDAVTLERLEYCILLDENGNKRFVQGPMVVFPSPTETFVEADGTHKFRVLELNENMGIYIKVIADYEEGGKKHKAGEELFITGKEQTIYFPRQEHAIVAYGKEAIHYAVAIPEGEGKYVLNKTTGKVELIKGPRMFLADPRNQVIVRRVLDQKTVELWFPGNAEAKEYNRQLAEMTKSKKAGEFLSEPEVMAKRGGLGLEVKSVSRLAETMFPGEGFERRQTFTPPRVITLDTKYDGAVRINVWTGYAIQIVGQDGKRRIVIGPQPVLLEYGDTLEVMSLSTGKPKTTDRLINTVYLLSQNNRVSDIVEGETKDLVKVNVTISYRVNFEGEKDKWFNVDNYVKLLTDHLRSLIRNAIKQHGVEDFNTNAISIVRDTVLGVPVGEKDKKRPGRSFAENGMIIYEVEVLGVTIGDAKIATLLVTAQHSAVQQALEVAEKERTLASTKRLEVVKQETAQIQAETAKKSHQLEVDEQARSLVLDLGKITNEAKEIQAKYDSELAEQTKINSLSKEKLARQKAEADQRLAIAAEELKQAKDKLTAEVTAVVERAEAFGPEVIAAMQAFSERDLLGKLAESMSPIPLPEGMSMNEVLDRLLKGTVLQEVLTKKIQPKA